MAKSIKMHYAEKDDPMFTGRFHINSVRDKDSGQKKKKKDRINKNKYGSENGKKKI